MSECADWHGQDPYGNRKKHSSSTSAPAVTNHSFWEEEAFRCLDYLEKTAPISHSEILQHRICTLLHRSLDHFSDLWPDVHICSRGSQLQCKTEAACQISPARLHCFPLSSKKQKTKNPLTARVGLGRYSHKNMTDSNFVLISEFPRSAFIRCDWSFSHHKWNTSFSGSPLSSVSHSSGQQKYQWWHQKWGWEQWWWPWRRKAGHRSLWQQKGAPVKDKQIKSL